MNDGIVWSDQAARHLLDATRCPLCLHAGLRKGRCPQCGADLTGQAGAELWRASATAADALRERERLLGVIEQARSALAATPAPASPPRPSAASTADRGPGATLQSVIATAGAALFAVAAIVFSYFTPELADLGLRLPVIGGVTLLFLGGAWLLARRRLQFSAEAVGGLGLVFLGLDVHAITQLVTGLSTWATASIATALAGLLMLAAARRARIRVWLWVSVLALAAVPALVGLAVPGEQATALGYTGAAYAAVGLSALLPRLGRPFAGEADAARPLRAEATALSWWQLGATAVALIPLLFRMDALFFALILVLLAGAAVFAACFRVPRLWALLAGVLATGAAASAMVAVAETAGGGIWAVVWWSLGGALALVLTALVPLPARTPRRQLALGSAALVGALSLPALVGGIAVAVDLVRWFPSGAVLDWNTWPVVAALAIVGAGLAVFALCARGRAELRALHPFPEVLATILLSASLLVLAAGAPILLWARVAVALGIAVLLAGMLRLTRTGIAPVRVIALVTAHLAIVVAMILVWREPEIVPVAGAATLVALAAVSLAVPSGRRFLHVGAGYGYALIVLSTALGLAGIGGIPQVCLTASAGLLGAIAATFLPRIGARNWQAVLLVSTVPFGIAIVQVVFERSGWTALSTGLMFVLALSLLLTRRPGLTALVRTLAAGMLVPTLAVMIVCLGAQLLAGSGSPVVLPVIAGVIALVLPGGAALRELLVARGRSPRTADAARIAVEASSLVTAAIAVLLALVREAAGLGTACLVLVVLGAGGVLTALIARRRYGWWLAGAAFAGAIQAFRWGIFQDLIGHGLTPASNLVSSVAFALLTAALLYAAAVVFRRATGSGSRWLTAPAVLAFAVTVWPAIERDWFVIWAMWALMVAFLALVVLAAARARTTLPPVWFLFGIAFLTGIVAWSPRDLRVEWFSLPMGAFLLVAGVLGWRAAKSADDASASSRLNAWPHGWRGSWALLAPGIVVMMSASIVATFTDPLTWRAILVMVLALAAILVGAAQRLAAPFLIGLVVLPIENVFVFSVQLGRGIESMPWWITLALMGAVLLIIAITGERREGVAARMRDLR